MHYIVFDLEWNGAGRANKVPKAVQDAIPFEIIEIGAVKLDEQLRTTGKFSTQIRPRLYPILTGPVAAVTRRHPSSMKYGLDFSDAARDFLAFCGDDYLFCTWSESDTATLLMNLRYYQLADRLEMPCIDVQYLFDQLVEQADMQRSIEYAIDFLDLPKSQPFHQAVNDAWYTGQIFRRIAELNRVENNGADLIARFAFDPNINRSSQLTLGPLDDKDAVGPALDAQEMLCPGCGAALQLEQPWEAEKSRLTAAFSCPEHGLVLAKCRWRRKQPGQFFAYLSLRISRDRALAAEPDPQQTERRQ